MSTNSQFVRRVSEGSRTSSRDYERWKISSGRWLKPFPATSLVMRGRIIYVCGRGVGGSYNLSRLEIPPIPTGMDVKLLLERILQLRSIIDWVRVQIPHSWDAD